MHTGFQCFVKHPAVSVSIITAQGAECLCFNYISYNSHFFPKRATEGLAGLLGMLLVTQGIIPIHPSSFKTLVESM